MSACFFPALGSSYIFPALVSDAADWIIAFVVAVSVICQMRLPRFGFTTAETAVLLQNPAYSSLCVFQVWSSKACGCVCKERRYRNCARRQKFVDEETCMCTNIKALEAKKVSSPKPQQKGIM